MDKTFSEFLRFLYKSSREGLTSVDESDLSKVSLESQTNIYENVQVFSDHLKATSRLQKTLYYADLSCSNVHPPLALTDATLELFNKTVPNAGRLDILNMDYAASLSRTVSVSPYSMVLAMMYLEQLRHKNPEYLESISPCELFVVSVLVASKYLFDNDEEFTYNCDWAEAAHMDVHDLNVLEKDFLRAINWELFTTSSDFFDFLYKIEHRIALKWTSKRGWLSYTDICILSRNEVFIEFTYHMSTVIIKVVLIITASYVAALFVLCGAFSATFMCQRPAKAAVQVILSMDYSSYQFPEFEFLALGKSSDADRFAERINNLSCVLDDHESNSFASTPVSGSVLPHQQEEFHYDSTGMLKYNYFCWHGLNDQTNCTVKQVNPIIQWSNNRKSISGPHLHCCSVVILPRCNYSLSKT